MPSRWCRSRPRSSSTAARSRRRASRSAASRTSRGATATPKRCCAARPPTRGSFAARGRCAAARRQGLRAQRLQDRAGAPRHRPRADAGGARHAAIAVQQEDPVSKPWHPTSAPPRPASTAAPRSPARRNMPASSTSPDLAYGSVVDLHHRQGPHRAHRRERGAARSRACSTCSRTRTGRHWRDTDEAYKDDVAPGRLAVPAALRRQDPVQRPADRAGRGRGLGDRALCGVAGARGLRAGTARHRPVCAARRSAFVRRSDPHEAARRRREGLCGRRRAPRRPNTTFRSSITIRWSCTPRRSIWEGDGKLTVYDKTQGVQNVQRYVCSVFGLKPDDVRVMSPSSAARSARACARNIRWCWPCWRRAR